jgi:chromosome segregation ATPase
MTISEQEYLIVVTGFSTELDINNRKIKELNDTIDTLRELRKGDLERFNSVEKERQRLTNQLAEVETNLRNLASYVEEKQKEFEKKAKKKRKK